MSDAEDVCVREATRDEHATVLGILDAAMLDVDPDRVRALIEGEGEGTVFVAVEGGRLLGTLVLDGAEVVAIAVRPGRRGRGIGSTLLERAAEHVGGELVAEFDRPVRPFYESQGFEIEPVGGDRFKGRLR